jgi:prophage DNA circulation protein
MPAWLDQYLSLPASIADIPFHVESAKTQVGRRSAVQKFPGTDYVRVQDLGAEADVFDVDGYLIGDDYHVRLKRLETLFRNRVGPFLLVHPYRGRTQINVEGQLEVTEERQKGGFARFRFRAIKDVTGQVQQSSASPTSTARNAVSVARTASVAAAATQVSQLSKPAVLAKFQTQLTALQSSLTSSIGSALAFESTLATSIGSSLSSMASTVAGLASTPTAAFTTLGSVVRAAVGAVMTAESASEESFGALTDGQRIAAMLGIAGLLARGGDESGLGAVEPGGMASDPSDDLTAVQAADRNAQAITLAVRSEVAATVCETILDTAPESKTQAKEVLAAISALLTGASDGDPDAVLYAVDAETYVALSDLRAAATKYLTETAIGLPTIETYELPAETSAFVIAQRLLGDASRWDEIVQRNDLDDPLFVPAGTTIEYLSA